MSYVACRVRNADAAQELIRLILGIGHTTTLVVVEQAVSHSLLRLHIVLCAS